MVTKTWGDNSYGGTIINNKLTNRGTYDTVQVNAKG